MKKKIVPQSLFDFRSYTYRREKNNKFSEHPISLMIFFGEFEIDKTQNVLQ